MKPSRYNLFYPNGNGTVVFNSATGRWARVSGLDANLLRMGLVDALSPSALKEVRAIGAVVAPSLDENACYDLRHKAALNEKTLALYVFAVTLACNLRCPYCFQREVSHQSCDRAACDRLVEAMKARTADDGTKAVGLWLFGGEPLLEFELCSYLLDRARDWAASSGVSLSATMTSNGVLFTKQILDRLAPHVDAVHISFDGPRDIHDSMRYGPRRTPTFERIVESIRMIAESRVKVQIRAQASIANIQSLGSLMEQLDREGILKLPGVSVGFGLVQKYSKCSGCESSNSYVPIGSEAEREYLSVTRAYGPQAERASPQIVPCIMTLNSLCIDPEGGVYKCITLLGSREHRIGHVSSRGRFEFDQGRVDDYRRRDPLKFEQCRHCAYLPLCGGGCPTSALLEKGSYHHAYCGNRMQTADSRLRSCIGGAT